MNDRLALKLNANNTKMIDQLFNFLEENPELFEGNLSSKSALVNMLVTDYIAALIKQWDDNPKIFYSDLKRRLLFKNKEDKTTKLIKLEHSQMDRINMILYLLMDTNQAILRSDKKSYLHLNSMFESGNLENEVFAKLADLVEQDNQKLFKKTHRQGQNLL